MLPCSLFKCNQAIERLIAAVFRLLVREWNTVKRNRAILVEIWAWHILVHHSPQRKQFSSLVHLQIPVPDSWANACMHPISLVSNTLVCFVGWRLQREISVYCFVWTTACRDHLKDSMSERLSLISLTCIVPSSQQINLSAGQTGLGLAKNACLDLPGDSQDFR